MSASTSIAVLLAILFASASAVPYSKYGRSCKDIGCRSDEVCVMAEDPCNSYQRDSCGRYPTCQRNSNGESCTTKFCPSGTYCKTENGKPTCVSTNPNLPGNEEEKKDTVKPAENTHPSNPSSSSSSYPGGSGYPDLSQTKLNDKPAPANPSSSGYPAGSGYPSGSSYPGYPSGSGYPAGSGYPSYPDNSNTRTTATTINANNNPPQQGGYPNPYGQYPPPPQGGGYPNQGGYNPNYPPPPQGGYPNQGGYNPNYPPPPQGGYPNQGGYNPNYPPQGGYDPNYPNTTKKPSITDQLKGFAKNFAKQVLTQAIIDKVSGRN